MLEFLYKWQTLITGVLALFSALITLIYLRKQISVSKRAENARRDSVERSARLVLPLTLSAVIDYCKEASDYWHTYKANNLIEIPFTSDFVRSSFQDAVASITNKEIIDTISKIVQMIQTQHSRMMSIKNSQATYLKVSEEDFIVDNAIIYSLAVSLLPYSCFESDNPKKQNLSDIKKHLMMMGWRTETHQDIYSALEKREYSIDD